MGDFRARDFDRGKAVDLIEAAYADRQIGDADRDLRVARARAAETLDELTALTRGLQAPAGRGAVRPGPARPPRDLRTSLGTVALLAVGVVVAVLGVAMISLVFVAGGESDSTSTAVEVPAASGEARPFAMEPTQVRRFLQAYERKFGTSEAYQVVFYPDRVSMEVPVRAPRPRSERWSYAGTWRLDSTASAVTGNAAVVDTGSVDVRRLFANIDTARKVLRVQRGELTHVVVHRSGGDAPAVDIHIGNAFNETGHLSTTPSGEEIRRHPYDA
jgi:hypothetical protein